MSGTKKDASKRSNLFFTFVFAKNSDALTNRLEGVSQGKNFKFFFSPIITKHEAIP
jgi:hypothetical protein